MIVSILFLIGVIVLGWISRKEQIICKKKTSDVEKVFLKMAQYLVKITYEKNHKMIQIVKKIMKKENILENDNVVANLVTLEPTKNRKEIVEIYYTKKIYILLLTFCVGNLLVILLRISQMVNDPLLEGNLIQRNQSGVGTKDIVMEYVLENGEKNNINLSIQDKKYSEEELNQLFDQMKSELEKVILNKNAAIDQIHSDLKFVTYLDNYPFQLKYSMDQYGYIDDKGKLLDEDETDSEENINRWKDSLRHGVIIQITVKASYEKYQKEITFPVKVYEKEITKEEAIKREIWEEIKKADQESVTEDFIILPSNINQGSIIWKTNFGNQVVLFLIATFVIGIGIYILKDRDLDDAVKKRQNQMLIDYPEIISKITLLTGAGMTIRNIFYRLAAEYKKKIEKGYPQRFTYEEILLTVYEMESGISEMKAYENFGKRCRIQQYIKLAALLTQNLKKSASGLNQILKEEATESFDIRKSMAKKMGEEAGTKLLMPMILMLGIVMVIIFYPAFSAFAS